MKKKFDYLQGYIDRHPKYYLEFLQDMAEQAGVSEEAIIAMSEDDLYNKYDTLENRTRYLIKSEESASYQAYEAEREEDDKEYYADPTGGDGHDD